MSLLKVDTDENFQRIGKEHANIKLKTVGIAALVAAAALIGYSSIQSENEKELFSESFDES